MECPIGVFPTGKRCSMNRSLKAALLSGLVFPGAGQLYLGRRRRGWLFILSVLLIFVCVVIRMTVLAYRAIATAAARGEAIDAGAIQRAVAASTDVAASAGFVLLVLLWIAAILDAWTTGERMQAQGDRESGSGGAR